MPSVGAIKLICNMYPRCLVDLLRVHILYFIPEYLGGKNSNQLKLSLRIDPIQQSFLMLPSQQSLQLLQLEMFPLT